MWGFFVFLCFRGGLSVANEVFSLFFTEKKFPITSLREIKILKALSHKNIIRLMEMAVERKSTGFTHSLMRKKIISPPLIGTIAMADDRFFSLLRCCFCRGARTGYQRDALHGFSLYAS